MLRNLYASSLDVIEAHPIPVLLNRGNIRAPRGDRGTIPSDAGSVVSIVYCFSHLSFWGCRWNICDCWRIIDLQHYIAYGILRRIFYEEVDVICVYSNIYDLNIHFIARFSDNAFGNQSNIVC